MSLVVTICVRFLPYLVYTVMKVCLGISLTLVDINSPFYFLLPLCWYQVWFYREVSSLILTCIYAKGINAPNAEDIHLLLALNNQILNNAFQQGDLLEQPSWEVLCYKWMLHLKYPFPCLPSPNYIFLCLTSYLHPWSTWERESGWWFSLYKSSYLGAAPGLLT